MTEAKKDHDFLKSANAQVLQQTWYVTLLIVMKYQVKQLLKAIKPLSTLHVSPTLLNLVLFNYTEDNFC